jgi:RimJ/RimL family protein N-acetyltransferase
MSLPISTDPPVIITARLILRPPIYEDFPSWAAFMADAEAAKFIGGPQITAMAWRGMAHVSGCWTLKGFSMFSVIERETGRWLGRIGPWQPEEWPGPEIGYGLIRDAWGKGYAAEGTAAAIDWALDRLGWNEFIHLINPDNTRSAALAARLGSEKRGAQALPPPWQDETVEVWGQSAEQWRRRKHLG